MFYCASATKAGLKRRYEHVWKELELHLNGYMCRIDQKLASMSER
jgi:hypothetical protein